LVLVVVGLLLKVEHQQMVLLALLSFVIQTPIQPFLAQVLQEQHPQLEIIM
jgi:hypothetical protein